MIEKILKKVIAQLIEEHKSALVKLAIEELKKAIMAALKDPETIREVAESIASAKKAE
jgi:acyl-CoA reductase-like NAD-dependent aldehyde dehydrogenase